VFDGNLLLSLNTQGNRTNHLKLLTFAETPKTIFKPGFRKDGQILGFATPNFVIELTDWETGVSVRYTRHRSQYKRQNIFTRLSVRRSHTRRNCAVQHVLCTGEHTDFNINNWPYNSYLYILHFWIIRRHNCLFLAYQHNGMNNINIINNITEELNTTSAE
jgi:predicted ABC-type exoprotein transport system permease subunit